MQSTFDSEERHQYALDIHNQWVYAPSNVHDISQHYFCGCPDRHRLKFVKPTGVEGKRKFKPYFGHITAHNKRRHGVSIVSCRGGGESSEHILAKHRLRELLGKYSFVVEQCPVCKQKKYEYGLGSTMEMEIRSSDGKWRYDCMLKRDCVSVMALEIAHTHFTGVNKVESTRAIGIGIAEFLAAEVLLLEPGGQLTNMQIVSSQCCKCKSKSIRVAIFHTWNAEIRVLNELDYQIHQGMEAEYQFRKFKQVVESVPIMDKAWQILSRYKQQLSFMAGVFGEVTIHEIYRRESGFIMRTKCSKTVFLLLLTSGQISDPSGDYIIQQIKMIEKSFSVPRINVLIIRFHTIVNALEDLESVSKIPNEILEPFKSCTWALLKSIEKNVGKCARCFTHGHQSEQCGYNTSTRRHM